MYSEDFPHRNELKRHIIEYLALTHVEYISIPYSPTQHIARGKAEEIAYTVSSFLAVPRNKNQYVVNVAAQHCVQVTPLARPVGWA